MGEREKELLKKKECNQKMIKFYYRLFSKICQKGVEKICQDCQPFIKRDSKILDLGCGSGIVAETFQKFFQTKILGTDIHDVRIRNIPFKIINGKNLPFSDNEFDIVLVRYVLHHAEYPKQLLEEVKRVSKRIIIYEDLAIKGKLDKIFCKFHLFTSNLSFPNSKDSIEYRFKTEQGWQDFFQQIGLKIIFKKRITYDLFSRLKMGKRIFFVLDKN